MSDVDGNTSISYRHENRTMWIDKRLGPKVGRKLLNGKAPNLSQPIQGRAPCEFTEGELIVIDPDRLWLTISKVRPRHGKWQVEYVLSDHRPRLLGKKAGYTDNPRRALRVSYRDAAGDLHDELEAPEVVGVTAFDIRNSERLAGGREPDQVKIDHFRQVNRLRDARRRAISQGVDTSKLDLAIERELEQLQRELDAAA